MKILSVKLSIFFLHSTSKRRYIVSEFLGRGGVRIEEEGLEGAETQCAVSNLWGTNQYDSWF